MGSITTTPGSVPGPQQRVGFDIRNNRQASRPFYTALPEYQADVDKVAASGGTAVRILAEPWMCGYHDDTTPANGWSWYQDALNLLTAQCAYAHAKGMLVNLTILPTTYPGRTDQEYLDWNDAAIAKIAATIGRYVNVVQIFNEHDVINYRTAAWLNAAPTPAYLTALAAAFARFAATWRAAAPHSLVTSTVYGWQPPACETTWQAYYDAVAPYCDAIGLNVYPDYNQSAITAASPVIARTAARYGKPVIVNEAGFQDATGTGLDTLMPALLDMLKGLSIPQVYVYTIRDMGDPGSTNTEDRFGWHVVGGAAKTYRAAGAAKTGTATIRAGARWGDALPLTAGASTDATTVTWRVISGGGRIISPNSPTALYLPPGKTTSGTATLGVTVDGSTEQQVTVTLAAHPRWAYIDGAWRPTKTGPGITR